MNLYYCQAGYDTVDLDLMVVAGDVDTALDVWRKVHTGYVSEEKLDEAVCQPFTIGVHLARPEQGYIEWGTFKFIPVELP